MNKQELFDALASLGMRPGRGLGQNFLLDANLLDYIIRASGAAAGMNVLEVGPGFGALTRRLLAAGANVWSIEFDRRLAAYLRRELADAPNFHLIEGDACKVDFAGAVPAPFHAVANLPYAISSVFIARLLALPRPPESCFFMLQKEMAQRLAAGPGSGSYGALSVRAQLQYDIAVERLVPPEVFYPPPEVDSALLSAVLKPGRPEAETIAKVDRIARISFNQRRKKLTNTLGVVYGAGQVAELLRALGIPDGARPENLTVENFIALAAELRAAE